MPTMAAMDTGTLIRRLGGPSAVAAALNLGCTAVSNWSSKDAIPREHHLVIWRMAIRAGIDWTPPDAAGLRLVPDRRRPHRRNGGQRAAQQTIMGE